MRLKQKTTTKNELKLSPKNHKIATTFTGYKFVFNNFFISITTVITSYALPFGDLLKRILSKRNYAMNFYKLKNFNLAETNHKVPPTSRN